jgi:hypothetical protein
MTLARKNTIPVMLMALLAAITQIALLITTGIKKLLNHVFYFAQVQCLAVLSA